MDSLNVIVMHEKHGECLMKIFLKTNARFQDCIMKTTMKPSLPKLNKMIVEENLFISYPWGGKGFVLVPRQIYTRCSCNILFVEGSSSFALNGIILFVTLYLDPSSLVCLYPPGTCFLCQHNRWSPFRVGLLNTIHCKEEFYLLFNKLLLQGCNLIRCPGNRFCIYGQFDFML